MWKRRALVLLAVASLSGPLASCSSCGAPRAEVDAAPPTLAAQSFRLANGMEVEILAGPCRDRAAIAVVRAVGADHDPPGRSGMSRIALALLAPDDGTGTERVVAGGADHGLDAVVVESDRVLEELDRLASRTTPRPITDADLARARTEVLGDVEARHGGDAALTAASFALESVQPSRGAGFRGGIAAEVEAITRAEAEAFLRSHLAPGSARLVVVGEVDAAAVRARIERAFATLPAGAAPAVRDPADSMVTGTLVMGDAPSAVAVAAQAPAPDDPAYPAFLVLAARLIGGSPEGGAWQASYDPIASPETLLVTGPVREGEAAEAAAARIRSEISPIVERPLAPADVAAARERFGTFLGVGELDPASCSADPRALAIARARRAQLGVSEDAIEALDAIDAEQLSEAAARLAPTRTAAVIGGGAIR